MACFSDRRQAAEKQVEKAERTISNLKAALASKEKELHDQHEELVRLRQAEEALVQAEAVECERLRVLANSLVCKLSFLRWALCFLISRSNFGCLMQLLRVRVRWRWLRQGLEFFEGLWMPCWVPL